MKHIYDMTKAERLEAVTAAFSRPDGGMDGQFALASVGLSHIAAKGERKQPRVVDPKRGSSRFVVRHPTNPFLHLSRDHIAGTVERRWTALDPRIFSSKREAHWAQDLKGAGEVTPVSEMKIRSENVNNVSVGR